MKNDAYVPTAEQRCSWDSRSYSGPSVQVFHFPGGIGWHEAVMVGACALLAHPLLTDQSHLGLSQVSMALDAARGLQALHEAPGGAIVHFDIKPQQLMLDKNGRIKINDLNMCRFVDADADGNSCAFESGASRVGASLLLSLLARMFTRLSEHCYRAPVLYRC